MLAGQDGLDEPYVTHWQEHTKNARFWDEKQTGEPDSFQQGHEQDKPYGNLSRRATAIEIEEHNFFMFRNYPHGSQRTSPTSQQSSTASGLAGV